MDVSIDLFNDLVEGQRTLEVGVSVGMIRFQLAGGLPIEAEAFRLDSEEVDDFIAALQKAKEIVRRK